MIPGNDLSSIWVSGEVTKLYIFSLFTTLDSWKGKGTLPTLLKNVMPLENGKKVHNFFWSF
jgi:hypothetical protein